MIDVIFAESMFALNFVFARLDAHYFFLIFTHLNIEYSVMRYQVPMCVLLKSVIKLNKLY